MINAQPFPAYLGMPVHLVESGTEVEHNGEKLTVDETHTVIRGREIFCTQNVYDKLKEQCKSNANSST